MQFIKSFSLAFCSDVNIYKKSEIGLLSQTFESYWFASAAKSNVKLVRGLWLGILTKNQKGLKPATCRSFGAPACANSHGGNSIIQNPKSKIECPSNTQLITEHSGWFRTPPRVAILFAAFQSADASRLATAALSASNPP